MEYASIRPPSRAKRNDFESIQKEKECFPSYTPGLVGKGLGVGFGGCYVGLGFNTFKGKEGWAGV